MTRKTLFGKEHSRELDKALLNQFRAMYKGDEYCKTVYAKYQYGFPYKKAYLASVSDEELHDILHACAYWMFVNGEAMVGNKSHIDVADLNALLRNNVDVAYDEELKELKKNGNGLGFLNSFVKEKLLSVTVAGKGSKTVLDRVKDLPYLYKVAIKSLIFGSDLALSQLLGSMKMVDGQSVSNFRPMSSAYIMYKYGILPNPTKDELTFYIPSEGWCGRLLSSYYIARKFPDKMINYISTDPSGDVVGTFNELVDYLMNYGGVHDKIKNWNPQIRQHGSDVEEANFYKCEGLQYDLSWTSPPYFFTEKYHDSFNICVFSKDSEDDKTYLVEIEEVLSRNTMQVKMTGREIKALALEKFKKGEHVTIKDSKSGKLLAGKLLFENGRVPSERDVTDCGVVIKKLRSGQEFVIGQESYILATKRSLGQSHGKSNSVHGWNENFFRPTMKNIKQCLHKTGTVVWNVANVRLDPTLEDDCVRITCEEGFEHIDTIKYSLQRVPGGILQKDGTRVALKDIKPPYEPVFIFKHKD